MALEANTQRTIRRRLRLRGAWHVKANPTNGAGVPDLLVCYRGVFIAAELKQPDEEPSRLQEHFLGEIRKAGGRAVVWWDPAQVEVLLDAIDADLARRLIDR